MTVQVPTHIRVQWLTPTEGKTRDEWPVDREETMKYEDYLALNAEALANTRARMIPPGEEADYKAAGAP